MKYYNLKLTLRLRFIILLSVTVFSTEILAQETSNSKQLGQEQNENSEMKRGDFRARIVSDYLEKFTEMSDLLKTKETELSSLRYRIEAVKERSKTVKAKEQKDLFRENIQTLEITEEQLSEEIKLLKKGLRILQENKLKTDPEKLGALKKIEEIEVQIDAINQSSSIEKEEIILSKIEVNDEDVYANPPQKKCVVLFNGIDADTKKERKVIGKEFFFGYTHPKLKNFFKNKHFLQCDLQLVEFDKKKYIRLFITIASKDARRTYGFIEARSPMKFELLSGEIVYASSPQNVLGRLEPVTGNTLYEVILPIDKSKYKLFSKGEVDKVGIMWTSGYEEYEVFHVDVVMHQIDCLENL